LAGVNKRVRLIVGGRLAEGLAFKPPVGVEDDQAMVETAIQVLLPLVPQVPQRLTAVGTVERREDASH